MGVCVKHIIASLLSLLISSPFLAKAAFKVNLPAGQMGADLSDKYISLMSSEVILTKEQLSQYKIIIVPGLLATYMESWFGAYDQQEAALRELGLTQENPLSPILKYFNELIGQNYEVDFVVLDESYGFSGEQSLEHNILAVAKAIEKSHKPVLLISHSKGSVEVLETLIKYPELQNKVNGWFSFQAPFWGSFLADVISSSFLDRLLLSPWLDTTAAITDLETSKRKAFMLKHLVEISDLSKKFPVISMGTSKSAEDMHISLKINYTLYSFARMIYEAVNGVPLGLTDGMVEIQNAFLPGSSYIYADGIDHIEAIFYVRPKLKKIKVAEEFEDWQFIHTSDFNRVQHFKVMLNLLLQQQAQFETTKQ